MQGKRHGSGSAIATGNASRGSSARPIRVRLARGTDRAFVLDTAARLADFGPPSWRTSEELIEGEARTLRDFFESPDDGTRLLIAETGDGRVGFALVEELRDYFTSRASRSCGNPRGDRRRRRAWRGRCALTSRRSVGP